MQYKYLLNLIKKYTIRVAILKVMIQRSDENLDFYKRKIHNAYINLNKYKMFAKFSKDIYNKYNE